MSKITCSVIEDMLPLYKEELLSEDSKALVEEHLQECTKCQAYLKDLSSSVDSIDGDRNYKDEVLKTSDKAPLLAIRKKLQHKKYITIACSVVLAITFMLIVYVRLTAPIFLPYSEDLITFTELDDGGLLATFSPEVVGYGIDAFTPNPGVNDKPTYYNITLWTNLLRNWIPKYSRESYIINRMGEEDFGPVRGVFYKDPETDDLSNGPQVIYGSGPSDGGMTVLPRLVLNMYFALALFLTLLGTIITFILRRRPKAKAIALRITLLPISYILGFLLVKGTAGASYTIIKDLSSILLLMFPIYFLMLLVLKLMEYRKLKST